jgi:hypothetical protein
MDPIELHYRPMVNETGPAGDQGMTANPTRGSQLL